MKQSVMCQIPDKSYHLNFVETDNATSITRQPPSFYERENVFRIFKHATTGIVIHRQQMYTVS